jgi:hypothetical protein
MRLVSHVTCAPARPDEHPSRSRQRAGSPRQRLPGDPGRATTARFAQWEHANATPAGGETWQADLIGYLSKVAASGDYPQLMAAIAAGGQPPDPDAVFARSLDRLLTALPGPGRGRNRPAAGSGSACSTF